MSVRPPGGSSRSLPPSGHADGFADPGKRALSFLWARRLQERPVAPVTLRFVLFQGSETSGSKELLQPWLRVLTLRV